MSGQPSQAEPRMSLTAVQELDRLARQFRRRLRDLALELSQEAGHPGPIGPNTILEAVPLACQELLCASGSASCDGGDSNGRERDAA